jgi:valyl-tRNA synthetase
MLGKSVLFNPGCDHAGLSTQSVVEKTLWKNGQQTRHDLGREKFIEKVWEWKEEYGDRIYTQLKRLGGSYDWDRARFTMDESLSKAVTECFVRLHEEGIIYRSNRLVNWCVKLNTTLSNLEVENKELAGRTLLSVAGYDAKEQFEFGVIHSFAYPIEDSDEKIVVATTRIETMLGDTAIAIHPKDERYTHLHGKFVVHPFNKRRIPIILDDVAVDMAFGTGAVKITPAHDFNDYEVGKRHNIPFINILNDDGTFNDNAAPYQGMKRFHVRNKIIEDLKALGLYIESKDNPMTVPVCSKSNDIIEPVLKPQWWVNCKALAGDAIKAVESGEISISPKLSERQWFKWLENIQDWCISRQLWWGHRCPVYFVNIEGQDQDRDDSEYWVSGRTEEEAKTKADAKFAGKTFTLEQDEDVLDTWFSSGLWPFSILGWPEKTPDFEKFYPTSLLETGWDILFFWVARMVMLGIKLTGKIPFSEVFCHAMIRDAHGRKMSKSLGNVIDPVDVIEGITLEALHHKLTLGNLDPREIEKASKGQKADFPKGIPECGTDALRFALCAYTSGGRDINLDIQRVHGYRKFCNKLWNATRFALMKLDSNFTPRANANPTGKESLVEKWILHKLNQAVIETNQALAERNFMNATNSVYNFWLYEVCDVFLEAMKPVLANTSAEAASARQSMQETLYICLDSGLKLLHPFMPFLTEELWQRLPHIKETRPESIVISQYPLENQLFNNTEAEAEFEVAYNVVKASRSIMADNSVLKGAILTVVSNEASLNLLNEQKQLIQSLIKGSEEITIASTLDESLAGKPTTEAQTGINVTLTTKQ